VRRSTKGQPPASNRKDQRAPSNTKHFPVITSPRPRGGRCAGPKITAHPGERRAALQFTNRRAATKGTKGAESTKAWPRKTRETQKRTNPFLTAKGAKGREGGGGGKDETGESRNLETEIWIGPITSSLSPLTFCLYAASSLLPPASSLIAATKGAEPTKAFFNHGWDRDRFEAVVWGFNPDRIRVIRG